MFRTIASAGLYLGAFVLFVEFSYFLLYGFLPVSYVMITIIVSLFLFFAGLFIRKHFRDKFAQGSVSKFLSIFPAFALVISMGKHVLSDYQYAIDYALKNIDNFSDIHFVVTITPVGIGLFF